MKKTNESAEKGAETKSTTKKATTPKTKEALSAIEKIRKLMEFKQENGSTEAEVENAIKAAQRLMLKHNLDKSDIDITTNDIDILDIPCTWKKGTESKLFLHDLLAVIAASFDCRVIRVDRNTPRARYSIVGLQEDREMTSQIFHTVLPQVRHLTKTRFKESDKSLTIVKFTISYQAGFIAGLDEKLKTDRELFLSEEKKQAFGLMIIKKESLIKEFIDSKLNIKTTSRVQKVNKDAFAKGKEDGSNKNINSEIGMGKN